MDFINKIDHKNGRIEIIFLMKHGLLVIER
jgi:hypothetical protein